MGTSWCSFRQDIPLESRIVGVEILVSGGVEQLAKVSHFFLERDSSLQRHPVVCYLSSQRGEEGTNIPSALLWRQRQHSRKRHIKGSPLQRIILFQVHGGVLRMRGFT